MNLDSRIKSKSDILSCFDIEKAKEFVGQKGYFENDLYCFSDVETCYYDTLAEVKDGDSPFKDDDCCYWNLFIPESVFLKSKKKYRALTIDEFLEKFHLNDGIILRPKNHRSLEFNVVYNGYSVDTSSNEIKLYLGSGTYTLSELFQSYERFYIGRWYPFGVEVEVEE